MGRAYLDHASTSPLRPAARAAVVAALTELTGDPGRIHEEAMATRVALEEGRQQVADLFGARSREVVFTSGATESIATAVWGASERTPGHRHQVVTAVEHSAVRLAAERAGEVTLVPVDQTGRVAAGDVLAAIRPDTAAVHIQWGNHEVGTIQPVAEVVAACRERRVLVHVDAAQAAGRVPIDFGELGADLLSISGHKLGGPPGTGVLLVRRGLRLAPLLVGGDQERARRAGMEPVAMLVGLGATCAALATTVDRPGSDIGSGDASAAEATSSDASALTTLDVEAADARRSTDRIRSLAGSIEGITVYGDPEHRLPHLVCLGIEGIEPQAVLLGLDRAGIAAHSGSACSSESLVPSPVLEAMGADAHRSLRLSVGWSSADADIDLLAAVLPRVVADLRALGSG